VALYACISSSFTSAHLHWLSVANCYSAWWACRFHDNGCRYFANSCSAWTGVPLGGICLERCVSSAIALACLLRRTHSLEVRTQRRAYTQA